MMTRYTRYSNRARVVGPLLAGAAVLLGPGPVHGQDDENRHQPGGTPVTGEGDALSSLLSLVPVSALVRGDYGLSITFGDMAAQLAAGGLTPPDSIEDDAAMGGWIHASYPILIADPLRRAAVVMGRDLLGYDVTDLDQTMEAGVPPHVITLLRGRFDQAAVAEAWDRNGYRMLEVDGLTVASLFETEELDLSSEIGRLALARMNNAAFLPDGTLAYAPTLDLLTEMITVAQGGALSAIQDESVATLVESLDTPLVSAIFFAGDDLSIAAQVPPELMTDAALLARIEAQLADPAAMPPVSLGLVGITAGGPTVILDEGEEPLAEFPDATIAYRLLMTVPGSADIAATVVDARLGTMDSLAIRAPYRELYGEWEASSAADGAVLALDILPAEGRPVTIWMQGLYLRDLLFLAW